MHKHLRRINYHEIFTEAKDERVNNALKRVFPRIKIDEIYSIINNTPYISDERKTFYKEFVRANYVEILMRGMEKIA